MSVFRRCMPFAHGSYLRTLPQAKIMHLASPAITCMHSAFPFLRASYRGASSIPAYLSFSPSLHDSETCGLVLHSHDNP
jgi:hypothetical protein